MELILNLSSERVGPLLATLRPMENEEAKEFPGFERLVSYMDSGSARSVCPRTFGPQFPVVATGKSQRGEGFQTATGKRVPNLGGRRVTGQTEWREDRDELLRG